jgi:hypothetical protein
MNKNTQIATSKSKNESESFTHIKIEFTADNQLASDGHTSFSDIQSKLFFIVGFHTSLVAASTIFIKYAFEIIININIFLIIILFLNN